MKNFILAVENVPKPMLIAEAVLIVLIIGVVAIRFFIIRSKPAYLKKLPKATYDAGDYFGFTTRLCTVELLVDRYYTLHICVEYENDFAQIFKAFNYPPVYPSLGRWEDSIRIDDVKIVEVKEELTNGKLNAYTWLPVEYSPVEKIGSVWKIPTYYKIVRDKRRFEYIRCYLGERGALASYRLDEDNEQLILI